MICFDYALIYFYSDSELTISSFNTLDKNQASQEEATNSLNQIKILLDASEQFRALGTDFNPNYAIVINWKNTSPNPAVFYAMREVSTLLLLTASIYLFTRLVYLSAGGMSDNRMMWFGEGEKVLLW